DEGDDSCEVRRTGSKRDDYIAVSRPWREIRNSTTLVAGRLVGTFLLVLLVVKALIWAIGLGSGTSGGVLAPLLVMGGTMGGAGGIGPAPPRSRPVGHGRDGGAHGRHDAGAPHSGDLRAGAHGRFRRAPRAADRQHRRRGRDRAPDASLDPHGEARPPRAPRDARVRRQPAACAARRGCDGAAAGASHGVRGAGGGLPRRITRDGDAEAARARGGGAPRGESRRSRPRGGLRG